MTSILCVLQYAFQVHLQAHLASLRGHRMELLVPLTRWAAVVCVPLSRQDGCGWFDF